MPNYEHQQKDIDADILKRGIFKGTGSGKSRIALLKSRGLTLIICPKTVRDKGHWLTEIEKLEKEGYTFPPGHDFWILSNEDFKKQWKEDPSKFRKVYTFIGDEGHKLAGVLPSTYQIDYKKYPNTSEMFTSVLDFILKIKPQRIFLLTATSTSQPLTVWGLATLLGYKWNYFQFRETFYFEKSRNIWLKKKGPKYHDLLARSVNHIGDVGRLQDWFDVPPQTHKEHWVDATLAQENTIHELKLLYPDPQVQIGKRHKLEQGLFEDDFVKENKTKVIEQYLHEFGKVVVYCRYTDQINMYEAYFKKKKIKALVLNGKTKDRDAVISGAEAMKEGVLIVQAQISEGYQLPSFRCMIFASEFSWKDTKQAKGRNLRADNLQKNLYIYLLCGAADARMREAVETGEEFDEEVHAQNIANLNSLV